MLGVKAAKTHFNDVGEELSKVRKLPAVLSAWRPLTRTYEHLLDIHQRKGELVPVLLSSASDGKIEPISTSSPSHFSSNS